MHLDNPDGVSIIIFGASGDLTQRKLIPALYNLYRKSRLPEHFNIVGAWVGEKTPSFLEKI